MVIAPNEEDFNMAQERGFINFMAPFIGAELGRAENNRINQYNLNEQLAKEGIATSQERLNNITDTKQAMDYLSTFFPNQDAAVKAGVSIEDFLNAQKNTILNDSQFQQFSPNAQQIVFNTLQKYANNRAAELAKIGEVNKANQLATNFGLTPATSQSTVSRLAGDLSGFMNAKANELGTTYNFNGTGDPVLDLYALAASNGDSATAQKLARVEGTNDLVNDIKLRQLAQLLYPSANQTQAQSIQQPEVMPTPSQELQELFSVLSQEQTPAAAQSQPATSNIPVTASPTQALANLNEEEINRGFLRSIEGKTIEDLYASIPDDVKNKINARLTLQAAGPLLGGGVMPSANLTVSNEQRNNAVIDYLRNQYVEGLKNTQQNDYYNTLLNVLEGGKPTQQAVELDLLRQLASANAEGQPLSDVIYDLANFVKANPQAYNGQFNQILSNYAKGVNTTPSTSLVDNLRATLAKSLMNK